MPSRAPSRATFAHAGRALAAACLLPAVAPAADVRPDAGTPIDVTTYHYDGLRTGWNPHETALTQASVKSAKFGLQKTLVVDGLVLAQPLVVAGFTMPDGTVHDVLLVVTGHDSVYAFDARTDALLWTVSLGTPQSSDDVACQQVAPEYGILATPVIVRQPNGRVHVYVVSATEPRPMEFHTRLHELDLATGANVRPSVEISPTKTLADGTTLTFDPKSQWVRAGLAWANDSVYVALSSHCDQNRETIAGWVQRYDRDLALMNSFSTITTPGGTQLAAIWMSGFAPAVDGTGEVFAVTGNGNFSKGGKDWGESVIKLAPDLAQVRDFFTPHAYHTLNDDDTDFGAGGVMLIPTQPHQATQLAVAMGKDPTLYLLDRKQLGRVQVHDAGALQAQKLGTHWGVWGGPAYFGGPAGGLVYYQTGFDTLRAFAVETGDKPKLTQVAAGTVAGGTGGSLPVVSSNGSAAGTGVVWVVHRGQHLLLEAYDAERLGAPIYSGAAGDWSPGKGNAFATALQANGRVWVGGWKTVSVFGLDP